MHVSRTAALAGAVSVIRGGGLPPGLITGVYALRPERKAAGPIHSMLCGLPQSPGTLAGPVAAGLDTAVTSVACDPAQILPAG
jgi:hypothetical protein